MRSARNKVLHELADLPLVEHVLRAAEALGPDRIVVVVGNGADAVRELVGDRAECVLQAEQLGTAHAVLQARKALRGAAGETFVVYGDVPLLAAATLKKLAAVHRRRDALVTVLSAVLDDPAAYGRVVRGDDGKVARIVEHADASPAERRIAEINSGTYCFDTKFLFSELGRLDRGNRQGEYYLTDLLERAAARGAAECVCTDDVMEALGVNDRADLALAEGALRARLIAGWQRRGVTFVDPDTAYVGADVKIGRDTVVGPNVRLTGTTRIGQDCRLDGSSYLADMKIAAGTHVRWGVVADGADVGKAARVGPYAHLRPQAELAERVHIGNFVEVKKSRIGAGSKANHLAYVGDTTVGRDANIGAGTITCNYDGVNKHRTVIGDRVQIGSDTQLVAPVKVGAGAFIAAGSTITRDVAPDALAFNDKPQKQRKGWASAFLRRARALKAKGG